MGAYLSKLWFLVIGGVSCQKRISKLNTMVDSRKSTAYLNSLTGIAWRDRPAKRVV